LAGERVNLLGLPRAELEAFVATRLGAQAVSRPVS